MATPDFILALRERIGTDPLWLMGATLYLLRDGATGPEVLLQRRTDSGKWAPVSGIVEPGEHPATCLVRDAQEEMGVAAEVERMLWCAVQPPQRYANGDQVQYLDHGYVGRVVAGEPRPDQEETTEVGWFPVDALPEPRIAKLDRQLEIVLDDPRDVVQDLDA